MKQWCYYAGLVLLMAGSILYYVLAYELLCLLVLLSGGALVFLSDRKIWVKILTILLAPVIALFIFFVILIFSSNEAI